MLKKICTILLIGLVTGSSGVLLNLIVSDVAYSQDRATINYFNDGLRQARSGWANLTPNQKQIDRQIEAVLQSIGKRSIPVTSENVTWMMQQIGANDMYTAGFVAGRMDVYAKTTEALNQSDALLCSIGTQFNIPAGQALCN